MALAAAEGPAVNPLLQELTQKGIVLGPGLHAKLFPPLLADGLDKQAQAAVIKREAARSELRYDDVMEKDVVAPHSYLATSVQASSPKAPALRIQVWFVAYGDLEALRKKEPHDLFKVSSQEVKGHQLTPEELSQRGISLALKPPLQERYVNTVATLLDRVEVSSSSYSVTSQTAESIVVANNLDPRFVSDKVYPSRSRVLGDPGQPPGPWQPYEGKGSYIKITRLSEPKNALFIEIQQITTEPVMWFNGAPNLRGKLPILFMDSVRNFRRMTLKTLAEK